MTVDELGASAREALRAELASLPVPEPTAVIRRRLRARTRALSVGVAAVVLIAGLGLWATTRSPTGHVSVAQQTANVPHFEAATTFLWTDASSERASGAVGLELAARLARSGESMSRRECSPGLFGSTSGNSSLFEDPNAWRDVPAGGPVATTPNGGQGATPPPGCSRAVSAAAKRLRSLSDPLSAAWIAQVKALESERPLATSVQQEIECLQARGYQVARDGYISDGFVEQQGASYDSAQAGRDFADCMSPLVAAREPVRQAALATFVAKHASEITELQRALDKYVSAVYSTEGVTRQTQSKPFTTTIPQPRLSARIVLPAQTMTAGSSIAGRVVVENNTGAVLTVKGCLSIFQVALGNATIQPTVGWLGCLQTLSIPQGESSYQVTVNASYMECSATSTPPCTDGRLPPLPPGEYQAKLYQTSHVVPDPPSIRMLVTG